MLGVRASALAVVIWVAAAPALAQPDAATKQQASELVKKAIAKSQAGDHEGAVEDYLAAYALIPNPILLSNVGSEYQQLEDAAQAWKYFCKYLDKDPAGTNATYATTQAKALQAQLGRGGDELCAEPKPAPAPAPIPRDVVEPPPGGTGNAGGTLRMVGLGTAGVGLVALGAGIYFGVQAKRCSDKITNHNPNVPFTPEELACEDTGPADEKKQIAFTVAGGVLAAAGVVVYFVGRAQRGKSEAKTVTIAPSVAPGAVGALVVGRF